MESSKKFEPVAKGHHIGRDGFCHHRCGCRVRGSSRICKHYYANLRSASTESALGTDFGDGGTERGKDPDLVHPGIPQPAPTFFHFPDVVGKAARLLTPDVVGTNWEHTAFLRGCYRDRLRRAERRRNP